MFLSLIFPSVMFPSLILITSIITSSLAQIQIGTQQANDLIPFPIKYMGTQLSTYLAFDSNWRWVNLKGGYTNCFTDTWVYQYCPDDVTCGNNCEIQGIPKTQWDSVYGVSVIGNALKIKYVTNGQYGTNVGDRLYLVDTNKKYYQPFNFKNRQFRFTVDVSTLECGINGALYSVEMQIQNPQAPYGTLYGDSQCPSDLKVVGSTFNTKKRQACSPEMDFWEANKYSTQFTAHPCSITGVYECTNDVDCGNGANRHKCVCDRDGGYWNPYQSGFKNFYGPGTQYAVNTLQPFTVLLEFITADGTDAGNLVAINRTFYQNGKYIPDAVLTDGLVATHKTAFVEDNQFAIKGGMKAMGQSLARGHVLVLSLWDDSEVNMLWLDSTYPVGSTAPGSARGPCPTTSGVPSQTRTTYPNAYVIYSDVQINPIGTPISSTPKPTPTPTPTPAPTPSACSVLYGQCGGQGWNGLTCCQSGAVCKVSNQYYSQCVPGSTPTPTPTPIHIWKCYNTSGQNTYWKTCV